MRVLLLCAAVAALQTAPSFSFTGTWNSQATISAIYLSSDLSCTSSSGYYYQALNHSFSTAGVRTINSFGIGFIGVANSSQHIDWTNLCNGSTVFPLYPSSGSGSTNSWAHFFEANTVYTFILGGYSSGEYGAEFWDATQGQTAFNNGQNQANRTWTPLEESSDDCSQSSADPSLFDTQVVSVNTSGYYNVFVGFSQTRSGQDEYIPKGGASFTVLRGMVSEANVSAATCETVAWVGAFDGSYLTAQAFSLWLDKNDVYTVVVSGGYFSGEASYYGRYGLTVTPAMRVKFGSVLTFQPPLRSSCTPTSTTCQTNTDFTPAAVYGITTFQVPTNAIFYIRTTQNQDAAGMYASRDLAFYIYNGQNPAAQTCGGISSTCEISADSLTGDVYTSGALSSDWTIVAQDYYDSNSFGSDASFDVYIITGPSLDVSTQTNAPTLARTSAPTAAASPTAPTAATPTAPTAVTPTAPTVVSTLAPTAALAPTAPTAARTNSSTIAPTQVNGTKNEVNASPLLNPSLVSMCVVGFLWL